MSPHRLACVSVVFATLLGTACGGNIPGNSSDSGGGTAGSGTAGGSGGQSGGGSTPTSGSDAGGAAGSSAGTSGSAGSGGSGGGYVITAPPPQSSTASWVFVDGYRLFVGKRVNGELESPTPFVIKGIGWSPTGVGETNTGGYADFYTQYRNQDVPLIEELNANTVKTYDIFELGSAGTQLLDDLYARGVMVIMSVLLSHDDQGHVVDAVNAFKDHPAMLMWVVGNEFNYNELYGAGSYNAARDIVNSTIDTIHGLDPDHPVAVSFGEVPTLTQYNEIPNADVWSVNIYPGLTFATRFNNWLNLSDKPMFVGEYGADAWNTNTNSEDQAAQSLAIESLTGEIHEWLSANDEDFPALGGTPYALTDEWWKSGNASSHDNGGFANAVHPDGMANEEWWGLCSIQRDKRTAFNTLAGMYAQ